MSNICGVRIDLNLFIFIALSLNTLYIHFVGFSPGEGEHNDDDV